MFVLKLGILLYLCHFSLQIPTPKNDSYIAAVMECNFQLISSTGNTDVILSSYIENIEEAAKQGADIFVSPVGPHLTMNRIAVPMHSLIKECPVPANWPDKFNKILVVLSKTARDNNIYVVVNLLEYLDCRTPRKDEICPGKQEYRLNTNIVFDRSGAIIARAGQYHIWDEPELTPEMYSNVSTFTTDFGVEFGSIIDFDVFFTMPTAVLVAQKSISNIVMPSKWYSELPFLTSIEVQKAFSTGYNINLLAAGNNNFKNGNGGSSIISGSISLVSFMQEVSDCRLLVAKVPKTPGQVTTPTPGPIETNPAKLDDLPTLTDPSLDKFITEPLKPGYQIITHVYRDITCKIIANVSLGGGVQFYRYRMGVFSGVRKLGSNNTIGARACAIMACTGDDIYSCGKRFPKYNKDSFAKFCELTVIGTAPKRKLDPIKKIYESTFIQTFSTSSLLSLEPECVNFEEKTKGLKTTYTLTLKNYDAELYTFGFWGRKFADDGKMETKPRIKNTVESLAVTPSDNSTLTNETPQGGDFFSIVHEVLAALNTLKKLIPRVLRRYRLTED